MHGHGGETLIECSNAATIKGHPTEYISRYGLRTVSRFPLSLLA